MASESVGRCAHVSARGVRCKSEPCPSAAWHRADDTEWNQCSADCRACALERGEAIATPPAAGPAPTLRDQFAMAAMTGFAAYAETPEGFAALVPQAYEVADAMLAHRAAPARSASAPSTTSPEEG